VPRRRLSRILIAEDDPDIQTLISLALSSFGGFTVKICGSGPEALECAPEFAPDLILLDVMMPAMDGVGTLAALREIPAMAKVPVIFLTARVQPQDIGLYKELGSLAVIQKPFEPSQLADTLKSIWSKARCAS
jgi:two-component system OmpR family response regulator